MSTHTLDAPTADAQTKDSTKTQKPPLYRVLLLNDDFTPMDFVVLILKTIFKKQDLDAEKIMLAVHQQGRGLAGVYTFEIAETKCSQVQSLARQSEYPLQCVMEPEESRP